MIVIYTKNGILSRGNSPAIISEVSDTPSGGNMYSIKIYRAFSKAGSSSPTNEFEESLQAMSDIYGQTPPRTRHSRKKRHMKQRLTGRCVRQCISVYRLQRV